MNNPKCSKCNHVYTDEEIDVADYYRALGKVEVTCDTCNEISVMDLRDIENGEKTNAE